VHKHLEKIANKDLSWSFKAGFVHKDHKSFWRAVNQANILFTGTANMDYSEAMGWDEAKESMLTVLAQIKELNPDIKMFFFEDSPGDSQKFSEFGTLIIDLHGDKKLLKYFRNL
jgi:hypothetical protein